MTEQSPCNNCGQKDNCKTAYARMGQYKGPSVLPGVVAAFVVPLLTFIITLTFFEHFTFNTLENDSLRALYGLILAAVVTVAVLSATKLITTRRIKHR